MEDAEKQSSSGGGIKNSRHVSVISEVVFDWNREPPAITGALGEVDVHWGKKNNTF